MDRVEPWHEDFSPNRPNTEALGAVWQWFELILPPVLGLLQRVVVVGLVVGGPPSRNISDDTPTGRVPGTQPPDQVLVPLELAFDGFCIIQNRFHRPLYQSSCVERE